MKDAASGLLEHIRKATKLGEYTLAEKLLLELIALKPAFAHAYTLLGNIYELTGDREKASGRYRQSIEMKPDNAEAYNNLGIVLKNQKNYKDALVNLKKALSIAGERADIRYNIGNVYKEMEKPDEAIEEYDAAIRLDPKFALSYNNLGIVFESTGRIEDAAHTYARGLSADPNNPRLRANLGVVLEKQGNFKAAREELTRALRVRPGRVDVMEKLASVLARLGEHKKAIALYNDILKIDNTNIRAANNLGIEYVKAGETDKASACYGRALAIDPEYVNAHFNLGSILLEEGYYSEALAEIGRVLATNPDDQNARFELGNTHLSLGQTREAEAAFQAVLKAKPEDPAATRALGNLSLKLGDYGKADEYFRKSRHAEKEDSGFLIEFARVLANKNEYEKVKAEISGFLKHHPDDAQAETLLGELCIRQGDTEGARKALESAIEKKPMIVEPYYHLARLHKESGNSKKAIDVLDKLIAIHGTRAASFDLLSLNEALSLYEEVTSKYERDHKLHEKRKYAITGLRPDESGKEIGRAGEDSLLATYGDKPGDEAIINLGVNEPVLRVNEEERVLRLVESKIVAPEEAVVKIEDSEPPPFKDLLRNQIVYDEISKIQEWALRNQRRRFIDVFGTEGYGSVKGESPDSNKNTNTDKGGYVPQEQVVGGKQPRSDSEPLTGTQQGIIEKVMDGMSNILKALYEKKTEAEAREPEPGQEPYSGTRERRRAEKNKHTQSQPREDKASGFLLEQEKQEREARELDAIPVAKDLRERLREYIRRIRNKLESDAPLDIPEDETEQGRIKRLMDEAYDKPVFDENPEHPVPPASELLPVGDESGEEPIESYTQEASQPIKEIPQQEELVPKEQESVRYEEITEETQLSALTEESGYGAYDDTDALHTDTDDEIRIIASEERIHGFDDEQEETSVAEPEMTIAFEDAAQTLEKSEEDAIDNYELIIDDHIDKIEDHAEEPAHYGRDTRDEETPSAGDDARSLAIVTRERKTEPVRIRVVTGVLSLISKLLVVIPMTRIRSNLRDRISGFIGRLKDQGRKKN